MFTGDLEIGEYSRGTIHKTSSLKLRKDKHRSIHSELAISLLASFHSAGGSCAGSPKDYDTNLSGKMCPRAQ